MRGRGGEESGEALTRAFVEGVMAGSWRVMDGESLFTYGEGESTASHTDLGYPRAPLDPAGRIVIVVDDGLATGATMVAALHGLRQRHPAKLVCAVPVSSPEALEKVRPLADELLCLQAPPDFQAVGQFYRDFDQVEDDEVIALLRP